VNPPPQAPMSVGGHGRSSMPQRPRANAAASNRFDPLRLALLLVIVFSVSNIHGMFPVLAALRPALVLTAFAVMYAFLSPKQGVSQNFLIYWPAKVVLALGITASLSVPFGISMGAAGRFVIENYSKVIVLSLLIMASIKSGRHFGYFIWAYVISAAALTYQALFEFSLVQDYSGTMRLNDLRGYDANEVGSLLVAGLPLALMTMHTAALRGRIFAAVTLVGMVGAITRSGSKGAFVGLLAVGVVLFFSISAVSLPKRLAVLIVAIAGLTWSAPTGYWERMQGLISPTEDYNWQDTNGRRQLAIRGFGYMMDRPLLGIGISNFPRAEGTISSKAREHIAGTGLRWAAAHNSYVQIGAEMGVVGLGLWVSLLFGGIGAMVILHRRLPRRWSHGEVEQKWVYFGTRYLPTAMFGFAISATFISFAYADPAYFFAALMVGLYASSKDLLARETLVRSTTIPHTPGPVRPGGRNTAH